MTEQQTPASDAGTRRQPLRRRTDGRVIAGVAAGVADHLGIDVVIVRILFVVTTIFTNGLGLIAYVLGWILIPKDDAPGGATAPPGGAGGHAAAGDPRSRPANGWSRDPLFWVGVGLLIVGAVWLLSAPGPFGPFQWFPTVFDPGLIWPLVLIAFGIALWRAGERRSGRDSTTGPDLAPHSFPDPAAPYRSEAARTSETTMTATRQDHPHPGAVPPAGATLPSGEADAGGAGSAAGGHGEPGDRDPTEPIGPGGPDQPPPGGPGGPAGPPAWTPPPLPTRESSPLGRITTGLALMTAGVLWIVQVATPAYFGVGRIAAAALLVIGLGLLVGSVLGRARWLIVVGLLLVPVVIVAELLRPVGLAGLPRQLTHGPFGEVVASPVHPDEVRSDYSLGAGSLRLDLSDVTFEEDTDLNVRIGAGEVRLTVPDDVDVVVNARIGVAGELRVFGQRSSGMAVERVVTDAGPSDVTLTIDVVVGAGEIRVDRAVTRSPDEPSAEVWPEWTDDEAVAELSTAELVPAA